MLNNKGVTTIEVLICFVLVTIIASSLFSTVSMFNDKRIEEANKSKILLYNNMLSRRIQNDFIKYGLSYVDMEENIEQNASGGTKRIYTINCNLNNEEKRIIKISQQFTRSNIHLDGSPNVDDEFMIEYGTESELVKYPIPELGEVKGVYDDNLKTFTPCNKLSESEQSNCRILKDLEINNVIVNVSNEQNMYETGSHVLSLYIGFYHPELGNRYAINIISPINFPLVNSNKTVKFNYNIIEKDA